MPRQMLTVMLALGIAAACEPQGRYEAEIDLVQAAALQSGLALHDRSMDRILYLEARLEAGRIEARRSELFRSGASEAIRWIQAGPDPKRPTDLFVLAVPVDERDAKHTTRLVRIPEDGSLSASYDLGSAYDQLRFSPEGDLAILFRGESAEYVPGLYNPNEIAILDLSKPGSETNPNRVSLPFGGRRIIDATFVLEPVSLGGSARRLAVFFVAGAVRIVDLDDPENAGATVPLVLDSDLAAVTPVQVIARDEDGAPDARLFVRAAGAQDVYEISLSDRGDGTDRFLASINEYQAGGEPLAMLLVEDGARPLLVILSRASSGPTDTVVRVVNLSGDDAFSVEIDDLVQEGVLAGNGTDDRQIVFYGDFAQGVYFLKVDGLYQERDSNLEDLFYPDPVGDALLLENDRLLLIPESRQDLILLNLLTRQSTRLAAPSVDNWQSAQVYGNRFFFVSDQGDRIDVVDLETEHPESLLLDDRIAALHLIRGSGIGLAWHDTPTGRATAFALDAPDRNTSLVVDGLWLDRFLEEKEVSR